MQAPSPTHMTITKATHIHKYFKFTNAQTHCLCKFMVGALILVTLTATGQTEGKKNKLEHGYTDTKSLTK